MSRFELNPTEQRRRVTYSWRWSDDEWPRPRSRISLSAQSGLRRITALIAAACPALQSSLWPSTRTLFARQARSMDAGRRYLLCRCIRAGAFKLAFFSFIALARLWRLLWGLLVACGDCSNAGRPGPASEPTVLSVPAPCAIADPQLAASNAAANVNPVAFNIG